MCEWVRVERRGDLKELLGGGVPAGVRGAVRCVSMDHDGSRKAGKLDRWITGSGVVVMIFQIFVFVSRRLGLDRWITGSEPFRTIFSI